MKECSRCSVLYKPSKRGRQCRSCLNEMQRIRRRSNSDIATKRYEKTKGGFLMRAYRNMLSRVKGIQRPLGNHAGLPILGKEEFYKWALGNEDFHTLFSAWEESKHDRRLVPSIDRIDPRFGYELFNMQIVTGSENTIRGAAFTNHGRII